MSVKLMGDLLPVWHNSQMGCLTDLWTIGNKTRKTTANLTKFLQAEATKEFILASEKAWGVEKMVEITGKGNQKKTMAHVSVMIYAAEHLSAEFHAHVIKTFCEDRILQWRDDSGEEFKALNVAVGKLLPGREGKSNTGIYINVAKMLRNKVKPDGDGWNTATADQLRSRTDMENRLVSFLELGFIRDWEHLKETIAKL